MGVNPVGSPRFCKMDPPGGHMCSRNPSFSLGTGVSCFTIHFGDVEIHRISGFCLPNWPNQGNIYRIFDAHTHYWSKVECRGPYIPIIPGMFHSLVLESYVMQLKCSRVQALSAARSSHALIFCVLVPGGLEDLNHRAARVGKIFEPSPCLYCVMHK